MFLVDVIPDESSLSTRGKLAPPTAGLSETSPPFVPLSTLVERGIRGRRLRVVAVEFIRSQKKLANRKKVTE